MTWQGQQSRESDSGDKDHSTAVTERLWWGRASLKLSGFLWTKSSRNWSWRCCLFPDVVMLHAGPGRQQQGCKKSIL